MNFIIYTPDGVIRRTGSCPPEMASFQAQPGELVLEGTANPDAQYVKDGAVRDYSAAELAAKNNLPSGFVWKMPERTAVDMRGIEDAQEQTWRRIKIQRARAEAEPFESAGLMFDANSAALAAAAQSAAFVGASFSVEWTLADNTVATLNGQQVAQAQADLAARTQALHSQARALRAVIFHPEATREQLDSLNLNIAN